MDKHYTLKPLEREQTARFEHLMIQARAQYTAIEALATRITQHELAILNDRELLTGHIKDYETMLSAIEGERANLLPLVSNDVLTLLAERQHFAPMNTDAYKKKGKKS